MTATYDAATAMRLALGDLEAELAGTRLVLARLPQDRLSWKPHEKSFSVMELGIHLANLLQWLVATIRDSEFDMAAAPDRDVPETVAALLELYDRRVEETREAAANMTVDDLLSDWTLRNGDHVIFTQTRSLVLRGFVLSHMIHHRGQLTVYLRMLDIPLPPVYGPTADEQGPPS